MIDEAEVACPYCFERVVMTFERDSTGSWVQDCEVCCNPWAVRVSRDHDGEPSVRVERAQ